MAEGEEQDHLQKALSEFLLESHLLKSPGKTAQDKHI